MNFLDVFEQQRVLLRPRRVQPRQPFVVSRSGHVQHPASHRDIEIQIGVVGKFTDQRED